LGLLLNIVGLTCDFQVYKPYDMEVIAVMGRTQIRNQYEIVQAFCIVTLKE
jgi:hypothetical protein